MDSFKLFQSYNNLKFLLSFSFFFVLFSLFPLLSQSLKPFLMQFCNYTIDKSYMFLLCNTLLGFIALYSSLFNTSSSITPESEKINRFEYYISESEITEPIVDDNIIESESLQKEDEEKSLMIVEEPDNVVIEEKPEPKEEDDDDDDDEEEEEGNALMIIDEDHETEELNKKCEDFIKKMKAVFCSDSRAESSSYFDYYQNQKSLVLVN